MQYKKKVGEGGGGCEGAPSLGQKKKKRNTQEKHLGREQRKKEKALMTSLRSTTEHQK